ncbi:sterol desaturase family protein [Rhodohalobacter barkolensis]|uniref:Sterol desaturase family protein n=1 Tax=Rhodohalobacter barkolensis TaxID=2053187 RepID=A0A2N0VJD3_9BACT|nr:sterol desaturase family protein [Rhodohalobacter barkolensis]PKD44258.1 sterol desaturase family protein [Rhodohalobacter barkolensis]
MESILDSLQEIQVIALAGVLILLFIWESLHPFYAYFTESFKDRGKHVFRNLVIGAINGLLVSVIFVGLWLSASVWAEGNRFGIMHWLQDATGLPLWAHAAGAILLLDFWTYAWHRMNHEIPFFWRFHSVHHSDNKMDVTTASRFHLGEIFFSSIFRIPLIALFGVYLWELVLYEIVMFAVVQFHHANVGLPEKYDRILRTIIVTPNMHRVHHSRWQPETDSNYSSLFSIWDRLARTFRLNPKPETIKLGLEQFDSEEDQTVKGMFKTPVKNPARDES